MSTLSFSERAEAKQRLFEQARGLAEDKGWDEDWLNDGVKGFLSARSDSRLLRSYPVEHEPGLRVFVPTTEYMLAMKLLAMRFEVGRSDIDDIRLLAERAGVNSVEQAVSIVEAFYPKTRIPQKTYFGIEELFGQSKGTSVIEEIRKSPTFRRPGSLQEVAGRVAAGEDFGVAIKEFLDSFAGKPRLSALAVEPRSLGEFEDAYCAAVAEHLCLVHGWEVPAWAQSPERVSQRPAFVDHGLPGARARLLVESPLAFRKRGIFVDARVCQSRGMGFER